ncbi:hypothetical protein GBL_2863 [Geobacillus kaustophilus GBlys]|uniref:Uncharacterized protein n=1 Tax=Geobacillus kaustophilus GBlys TaxID=1337888 RepID=U2WV27_GEOKU|nr:hypothetical protein GBL_2863 [Geobacillus kaustophilus GBlys]
MKAFRFCAAHWFGFHSRRPVKNGCHEQISGISPKKKADFARFF